MLSPLAFKQVAAKKPEPKVKTQPKPKSNKKIIAGEYETCPCKLIVGLAANGVSREELDADLRHAGNDAWRKLFSSMAAHFGKKLSEKGVEGPGIVFKIS